MDLHQSTRGRATHLISLLSLLSEMTSVSPVLRAKMLIRSMERVDHFWQNCPAHLPAVLVHPPSVVRVVAFRGERFATAEPSRDWHCRCLVAGEEYH